MSRRMLGLEVESQRTPPASSKMVKKRQHANLIILDDDESPQIASKSPVAILSPQVHIDVKRQRLQTGEPAMSRESIPPLSEEKLHHHAPDGESDASAEPPRNEPSSSPSSSTAAAVSSGLELAIVAAGEPPSQVQELTPGEIVAKRLQEYKRNWHQVYQQATKEEEERALHFQSRRTKRKVSKRPDIKAYEKMKAEGKIFYPKPKIGELEGMGVGFLCNSRAEMAAIGLHSKLVDGIDFIPDKPNIDFIPHKSELAKSDYRLPVATCIVMSGGYEDDKDEGETIFYSGRGGNNQKGDKRQIKPQELNQANLAMMNSFEQRLPIRVVRGHKSNVCSKVYTLNGLYEIVDQNKSGGQSGFPVYSFELRRLGGQLPLQTEKVQFLGKKDPGTAMLEGLVSEDIACGLERISVPASNVVDNPPIPPPAFEYLARNRLADDVVRPVPGPGCSCVGSCMDSNTCACARLNGGFFPYTSSKLGERLLVMPSDVVYECGPLCGCGPTCVNRASQGMLQYRLQVFRTRKKGWGVKTWDFIPAGAPVCEYTGDVMKSSAKEGDNNYMFHLDCIQTIFKSYGRERRPNQNVKLTEKQKREGAKAPKYCIDAGSSGSVARFINHGCDYNLFVQPILSDHHDLRLTRIVLVAAVPILPGTELSYDYGYNQLDDTARIDCHCGADGCRKRLR